MVDGVSSGMAGETASGTGGESKRRLWSGPGGRSLGRRWHAAKSRGRLVWQFSAKYAVVPLGSGFLLGRAIVLGTLHPFGTAFVVALAAIGQRGRSLVAAVGVLLAALSSPAGSAIDDPAAVLVFVWLAAALVGGWLRLAPWVSASGAMLGAASLRIVSAAFAGESLMTATVAGAVDLTAAWVLVPVVAQLFGPRSMGRVGHPSSAEQSGTADAFVRSAALLLFVSLLFIGTVGVHVAGYSVHAVLTRMLVLTASFTAGVGGGATAGTLLGLLTLLGGGGELWEALLFAGAGLGAGLGCLGVRRRKDDAARDLSRSGAVIGLIIAHLLLSSLAPERELIGIGVVHSLLAGGIVLFLPGTWLSRWRDMAGFAGQGGRPGGFGRSAWRRELLRFASVFEQAATTMVEGDARTSPRDVPLSLRPDGTARQAGKGQVGPVSDDDWGDTASDNFHDVHDELDSFVDDVYQMVCRGCSRELICWETYGYQTYRDVLTMVADSGAGDDAHRRANMGPSALPAGLKQRCIKPQHFAPGVEKLLELVHNRSRRERQMQQWQAPLQRQLNGLAEIIAGVAVEISRLEKETKSSAGVGPRFQLQTDYVHLPGDAAVVSGDSFVQVELPEERVAFIVCDGMGSGTRAAAESRAVVAMLSRFLEAGFDLPFCVQTINAVMLLRAKDESFVTVDASVVDLRDGTIHIAKTGAAPTYIHKGDDVEMVRADSLPLGVLPEVEVFETKRQLQLGDVFVMMSDGGLELGPARGDRGEWMRRHMQRLERPRPKQVVDSLFARAHYDVGQLLPDDLTIVAAQLLPAVVQ